jgi:serine/threonine-protein kinase RsbW
MGGFQVAAASPLPLWWSRRFPGEPRQAGKARSWVTGLLPAGDPLDDLLIFASELATNAITHTRSGQPGGWFTVEVTWSPSAARVVVGDQGSDEIPMSKASPDDDAADIESGRGLLLIDTMSAGWGSAGDETARWLWADVDWRSRGGLPPSGYGDNSATQQFAALGQAHPGTTTWYDSQSGQWCAALPAGTGGGTLSAPSPAALLHLLAARYPQRTGTQYLTAASAPPSAAISHRTAQRRTS